MGPGQNYIFGFNFRSSELLLICHFFISLAERIDNYSISQQVLEGSLKYLDQNLILAYELGTEPDLYALYNGKRAPDWTVLNFNTQMEDWYHGLQSSTKRSLAFQFGALVGPLYAFGDFTPVQLIKAKAPQTAGGVNIPKTSAPVRINLTKSPPR